VFNGAPRAGVVREDPEPPEIGSEESKREIIALITQKVSDCCDEWIIA